MNGVEGTTNVASDLNYGTMRIQNTRKGSLTNLGTVGTRHEKLK
jgi:hypothetical protein